MLAQGTNDLGEAVPLVADLLSIPVADRFPMKSGKFDEELSRMSSILDYLTSHAAPLQ